MVRVRCPATNLLNLLLLEMSGMCVDVMSSALSTYHNEVFPFASTDDLNPMFIETYIIIPQQLGIRNPVRNYQGTGN